jgi:hypothetical protein
MTQEHPITPPLELLKHWEDQHFDEGENYDVMLIQAYQAGADQELEACCKWLGSIWPVVNVPIDELRTARRPKPPSLKAGAIEVLDELDGLFELPAGHYNTILRALEQLDDSL